MLACKAGLHGLQTKPGLRLLAGAYCTGLQELNLDPRVQDPLADLFEASGELSQPQRMPSSSQAQPPVSSQPSGDPFAGTSAVCLSEPRLAYSAAWHVCGAMHAGQLGRLTDVGNLLEHLVH